MRLDGHGEDQPECDEALGLRRRFAQLTAEVSKFGVMAVVSTAMAIVGTIVLHLGLRLDPLASNAIATVIAVTASFIGNRWWIFRHRKRTNLVREYVVFFVLNGVALLIQLLSIGFAVDVLGRHDPVSYNVSLLIGVTLASLARYVSYKKWVFLSAEQLPTPSPANAPPRSFGPTKEGRQSLTPPARRSDTGS